MQKFYLTLVLTSMFILLLLSDATAEIIEMVDTSRGKLIVREADYEQKLYLDDRSLDITNRFVKITRIIPDPGQDEVFLVSTNAGGSGTMPCYMFVIFKPSPKMPEISECLGTGYLKRLESDEKTVSLRFGALHGRFDGELIEPGCTVEYKNGKILKNGKPLLRRNKFEPEDEAESPAGPHAETDILPPAPITSAASDRVGMAMVQLTQGKGKIKDPAELRKIMVESFKMRGYSFCKTLGNIAKNPMEAYINGGWTGVILGIVADLSDDQIKNIYTEDEAEAIFKIKETVKKW